MRKSSLFQARHYEAIANVLDQLGSTPTHIEIVDAFAAMFKKDNANFQGSLFYFAAGEPEMANEIKNTLAPLRKPAKVAINAKRNYQIRVGAYVHELTKVTREQALHEFNVAWGKSGEQTFLFEIDKKGRPSLVIAR